MVRRSFMLLFLTVFLATGCSSLLPTKTSTVESRWKTYDQARLAFDIVEPHYTRTNDLASLGFYPGISPNIKILTYADLVPIFMPNPGIRKNDLPAGVVECIDAHDRGFGYVVDLQNTRGKRYGNVLLDMFGFKRQTHETGWEFKGLILVKDDMVVYKLSSGQPKISRDEKVIRPLGPFQEIDGLLVRVVPVQ